MSPRSAKQFEEMRESSRRKIMDVALDLFAHQGFHSTSISQIARQAGVAKGLVNHYFKRKEDLMVEIVFDGMRATNNIMQEMGKLPDSQARLRFLIEYSFDYVRDNLEYTKLLTSIGLQLENFPDLVEVIQKKYQGIIPFMTMLMQVSGIPNTVAEGRILAATMDGIVMQYIIVGDAMPFDQIKQDLIDKYCSLHQ
ncbi:MAG: helix-turn-helix domain-containing protein [Bacteroidota bacterium]